jgi:hypothetical protein
MFGQMQREQLGLIREELEAVRRLTDEVRALQATVARQAPPAAGAPRPGEKTPPRGAVGMPGAARGNGRFAPLPGAKGCGKMPAAVSPAAGPDIHGLLCQRIQELQRERESHWDKLLHLLCGK